MVLNLEYFMLLSYFFFLLHTRTIFFPSEVQKAFKETSTTNNVLSLFVELKSNTIEREDINVLKQVKGRGRECIIQSHQKNPTGHSFPIFYWIIFLNFRDSTAFNHDFAILEEFFVQIYESALGRMLYSSSQIVQISLSHLLRTRLMLSVAFCDLIS